VTAPAPETNLKCLERTREGGTHVFATASKCNNSCGVYSDRGVCIYIFWCGCDVQQKVRRQDSLEDVVSVSAHSLWEAAPVFGAGLGRRPGAMCNKSRN